MERKEPCVIRECKIHGITEFNTYINRGGIRYRCKKCASISVASRRRKLKRLSIEYKGGCCSKCGYSKSPRALQFHHLDPSIKEFGFGKNGVTRSWKKVKLELDKCILLCSNCHAEEHDKIEENKFVL